MSIGQHEFIFLYKNINLRASYLSVIILLSAGEAISNLLISPSSPGTSFLVPTSCSVNRSEASHLYAKSKVHRSQKS